SDRERQNENTMEKIKNSQQVTMAKNHSHPVGWQRFLA
ncbi:MAG: hypothetical protein ACI9VT_004213, partial [Psychroserpens sp.]